MHHALMNNPYMASCQMDPRDEICLALLFFKSYKRKNGKKTEKNAEKKWKPPEYAGFSPLFAIFYAEKNQSPPDSPYLCTTKNNSCARVIIILLTTKKNDSLWKRNLQGRTTSSVSTSSSCLSRGSSSYVKSNTPPRSSSNCSN